MTSCWRARHFQQTEDIGHLTPSIVPLPDSDCSEHSLSLVQPSPYTPPTRATLMPFKTTLVSHSGFLKTLHLITAWICGPGYTSVSFVMGHAVDSLYHPSSTGVGEHSNEQLKDRVNLLMGGGQDHHKLGYAPQASSLRAQCSSSPPGYFSVALHVWTRCLPPSFNCVSFYIY